MKRIAVIFFLLSTPALAQQQQPQTPEDTIAIQNQLIGQLYIQVGTLQQQLSRDNNAITDLTGQVNKLKAAAPAPAATPDKDAK